MEAQKNISPSHQLDREPPAASAALEARIRTERDARRALAFLFDDERELNQSAAEFFKLGNSIAGRAATPDERETLLQNYYERIIHHRAAREAPTEARREAIAETLEGMRADNLRRHSTFEAHRAHVEIESFNGERDDPRALYNAPEDRTRAEHAGRLHAISPLARDAYERGATVYGDVLVTPREAVGRPANADQIRAGSLTHAVREFTPLLGSERAKEVASEFVELGRQIAGRTADGDTRLVVFRAFYHEITLDPATGKFRPRDEQAARIEPTLERMRVLAEAMRDAEWKRDRRAGFVEFGEWERSGEDRQRDAEHEATGRLTYRVENISGLEPEHDEIEEPSRERALDEREVIGRVSSVEYERVRLTALPPRLPDGLTEEDERRLRYEIVPRIDRQLEAGARPRDIAARLYTEQRAEAERSRDERAARIMERRAPAANIEHPLTRAEELRALYTLQTLTSESERVKVGEEIARLAPSERERAEAIEAVGARLAQEYRQTAARLNAYKAAETEREQLSNKAQSYESARRASAELQLSLQQEREDERERTLTEREALIRSNNSRFRNKETQQHIPNYPELTGEVRPLSTFAELRGAHVDERARVRADLVAQLISPDIEEAKRVNYVVLEEHREHFRRAAGSEVANAKEARAALAPRLNLMRAAFDRLHAERSQIDVERSRPREQFSNPVFVGVRDGSLQLPVENFNEYKTLTKVAREMRVNTRVYESQLGGQITGERAERDAVYTFARDYVSYRAQDDVTRLRNEKPLFREYAARLDGARSAEELRARVGDIRRDNYQRAIRPELFVDEGRDAVSRGEQPRRPLSTLEMRKLFLLPAPEHYTAEMRDLRLSRADSGRDRAGTLRALESGARKPSPELATLLREFNRTRHDSPERYSRNIKAFLGDYLNPPDQNRSRFSPENLYELGRRLPDAERDYLFRVVDSTKRALLAGVPPREIERGNQLARSHESDDRALSQPRYAAKDSPLAGSVRDSSTSFRLYYGAAAWREAGQLVEAASRLTVGKPLSRERETVVRGIRDHDLETVAALLVESAAKPRRVEDAAAFLRGSQEPERRQLGEILQTFRAMKESHDQPEGRLHFQITTPANSELGRDEWTRLLDHLPARVNEARGVSLPEAQRGEIKRAALRLAWSDVENIGRQQAGLPHNNEQAPGRADDFREAIEQGRSTQKRARAAADALGQAAPQDQYKRAQLSSYAARTKSEYLESFREIDEQLGALSRGARRDHVTEGREAYSPVRDEMKTKVAAYLTDVVRAHGTDSLERDAVHHTNAVSHVIKVTLQKHGYDLVALNLDDERVNSVTGKLVGELPGAIRESREQTRINTHQLADIARREPMLPNREIEHASAATALYAQASHNHGNSSSPRNIERLHNPDDEFVEQEVNRTIGQIREQASSVMPTSYTFEHHHHPPRHKAAPAHGADAREQHTHRYVLTR